jgi:hypothetical protein
MPAALLDKGISNTVLALGLRVLVAALDREFEAEDDRRAGYGVNEAANRLLETEVCRGSVGPRAFLPTAAAVVRWCLCLLAMGPPLWCLMQRLCC